MMLLRVVLSGAVVWLLLAVLWMGLPSPSHEYSGDPNAYATWALQTGRTLTRIYEYVKRHTTRKGFNIDKKCSVDGNFNWLPGINRHSFALDYRLDIANKVLHIGDTAVDLVNQGHPVRSETISVLAKTGDPDGINPPWFSHADSTLLFWWVHRDTTTMLLQVIRTDSGTFAISPIGTPKVSSLSINSS